MIASLFRPAFLAFLAFLPRLHKTGYCLALLLSLCAPLNAQQTQIDREHLIIGSKAFTESRLLAEIMGQLITARTDIEVTHKVNLSGSIVTFSAIREHEIDIYPEYTGTLWYGANILNIQRAPKDALEAYAVSQEQVFDKWGLQLLQPFGFNNTYVLGVHPEVARKFDLKTISDLHDHLQHIRPAFSHEFTRRNDGWDALIKHYDLPAVPTKGIEHGLVYQVLANREADLIDSYSTDGKLLDYPVALLEDDRNFFPPYQCAPIVSELALQKWPQLRPVLAELGFRINDSLMRKLNHQAEVDGDYKGVAANFLHEQGLLESDTYATEQNNATDTNLEQLKSDLNRLRIKMTEHLLLAGISILLALAIAVPLGLFLSRHLHLAGPVIWAVGMLQTIPSLALLAFLITVPWFGLGTASAITAITIYALLPILRNVFVGIMEVDAQLIDTAYAMGLRNLDVLIYVELPLAVPTIMAGIRTASIICIGTTTLAAFVGAGGLGELILTGLQLVDAELILWGALPAAALALLTDILLGRLERWIAPYGSRTDSTLAD
ncbi:MAG: glycine betaine ABC transporter substrate-binding protein [Gammaproteobacteria bacterium]